MLIGIWRETLDIFLYGRVTVQEVRHRHKHRRSQTLGQVHEALWRTRVWSIAKALELRVVGEVADVSDVAVGLYAPVRCFLLVPWFERPEELMLLLQDNLRKRRHGE